MTKAGVRHRRHLRPLLNIEAEGGSTWPDATTFDELQVQIYPRAGSRYCVNESTNPPLCLGLKPRPSLDVRHRISFPRMLFLPYKKWPTVWVLIILAICTILADTNPITITPEPSSHETRLAERVRLVEKHPPRELPRTYYRHWGALDDGWNVYDFLDLTSADSVLMLADTIPPTRLFFLYRLRRQP